MGMVRKGFSLGEMVVALAVLSLLSVIMVGVVPSTVIGLREAELRANAAVIGQDTLENLRRAGFGNVQSTTPPHPVVTVDEVDYTVEVVTGTARASDGNNMDPNEAKDVQVLVRWKGKHGEKMHQARAVMFKRI